MSDEGAVKQFLEEYYRAFSTLEMDEILRFFHQPFLFMGPAGVFIVPTTADLADAFSPAVNDLRARGYGRSELNLEQLTILSTTAALARGVALRYKTDGDELEHAGVTYLLYKTDAGWKIAVLVLHDAGSAQGSRQP